MDLYDPNYRYRKIEEDKLAFEKLDLKKTITDIYFNAINKAEVDYLKEIENHRQHCLNTSYTEEQAQEKFNIYTENIRYENEEDDCYYREIKNSFLKNFPNESREDLQQIIIDTLYSYINSEDLNFSQKLRYIKELPLQIYESNKLHRKFEFFKNFAEKYLNNNHKESEANRTDIAYYCYYTSETKTLELRNIFPSSKAWDEIGTLFNKNAKNIQTAYNLIYSNEAERLKKTRIKNIEFVIEKLLKDNSKALELANKELKIAKLNL